MRASWDSATEALGECALGSEHADRGGEPEEWDLAPGDRWRAQPGEHPGTELVITTMQAALAKFTQGNCLPKALASTHFCEGQGLPWLPAAEESVLLHMGALLRRGTVAVGSMQPYLSAIKNNHEETSELTSPRKGWRGRFEGPAKGRAVVRVQQETETGAGVQQQDVAVVQEPIAIVLCKGKGRQLSAAVYRYIVPTAVADEHMWRHFSWLAGSQQHDEDETTRPIACSCRMLDSASQESL
eukprot:gene16311-biopygen16820